VRAGPSIGHVEPSVHYVTDGQTRCAVPKAKSRLKVSAFQKKELGRDKRAAVLFSVTDNVNFFATVKKLMHQLKHI